MFFLCASCEREKKMEKRQYFVSRSRGRREGKGLVIVCGACVLVLHERKMEVTKKKLAG